MAAYSDVSDGIMPKFKLIKAFMVGLVTCKNEEDPRKMKALGLSQCLSDYKSMGIFPNAHWQLTHKSFFGYCQISNTSKILWLSSFPARIKQKQLKMKELSRVVTRFPQRRDECYSRLKNDYTVQR